jgi:hypothetical protein
MISLSFGNYSVKNGETIDSNIAQAPLDVSISVPDGYYTLIMYDMSAPNAQVPTNSPFLHFLEINIPGNRIDQGDVLQSYHKPSPPPNSGNHVYVVDLFRQVGPISTNVTDERANFPLLEYVQLNNLQHVGRTLFQIPSEGTPRYKNPSYNEEWIRNDTGLTEQDVKYCRCVLEVAGRQPRACNEEQAWFEQREGRTCYNPYAVCHRSISGESGRPNCGENYVFEKLPERELIGYASLQGIDIPDPYNRQQLIENIYRWKQEEQARITQFQQNLMAAQNMGNIVFP